eukprot:symbB.v1.2.006642.t1/scaffold394.1/size213099/7
MRVLTQADEVPKHSQTIVQLRLWAIRLKFAHTSVQRGSRTTCRDAMKCGSESDKPFSLGKMVMLPVR